MVTNLDVDIGHNRISHRAMTINNRLCKCKSVQVKHRISHQGVHSCKYTTLIHEYSILHFAYILQLFRAVEFQDFQ